MSFKRGLSTPAPTANAPVAPAPQLLGRQVSAPRQAVIVAPTQTYAQPNAVIARPVQQHEQPVRGLLVGNDGKPLRGLSQQTLDAHKAYAENATEQCMWCGKFRPPAHMKTIIQNAVRSSNPLRLCDVPNDKTSCAQLAYKDPHKAEARQIDGWKPSIPSIRFDRENASAYLTSQRNVSISDLVTRDTYHKEREVDPRYRVDSLTDEGRWSGGGRAGHVVTAESVAQSRERAARVRR